MTAIDRRKMLRILAGSAAIATAGLALIPVASEATPLEMSKSHPANPEVPVEEAVWVRRRRCRRCWWRRGRKICRWRRC
jgi:hypothetical protein